MLNIETNLLNGTLFRVLILGVFAFSAPTSSPSRAELAVVGQSAEELALLEELAGWIEDDVPAMPEAIRQRQQSFDVFRSFHTEVRRSAPLATLPYGPEIRRTAARHRLDSLLLASIVEVESGFAPQAASHRGATGLMQLMPATAGPVSDQLYEPEINLDAGARYLRHLLKRFEGDLELALAAYNAGPGNVERYGGVPPFSETRNYVDKVLEIYVDHHRTVWQESETAEQLARL